MTHRYRLYGFVLSIVVMASIWTVPVASAGTTYTYTSGLNRYEGEPPQITPANLGSISMQVKALPGNFILVKSVTVKSNHMECIEFPNGNPPAREFSVKRPYSKTAKVNEKLQIKFPGVQYSERTDSFEVGDWFEYPYSDWEWKWKISVEVFEPNPNSSMHLETSIEMKPNQFATCDGGGIAKKWLS